MLALVDPSGTDVREVPEARVDLSADVKEGYRWLPVVQEVVDESLPDGGPVITEPVETTVEPDRVLRRRRRRNMTPEEADTSENEAADAIIRSDIGRMFLSVYRVMFALARQSNPNLGAAQFRNMVISATNATDIPDAGFRAWVRDRL